MSLFSGLEKFGLGSLKGEKIFDNSEKKVEEKPKEEPKKVSVANELPEEKTLVFEKKYVCPVCETSFTSLTVRTGKVHVKELEMDLHPIYDFLDEIKYDIVACPACGYATLARYFETITKRQKDAVRERISLNFRPIKHKYEIYTYDDALERYQLALANAIVKDAKASEKAYLCLRYAWLVRQMLRDPVTMSLPHYDEQRQKELKDEEKELLKNALEGFVTAKQSESFPIAGMNTITLDYLLAALYMENEDYSPSLKLIGEILVSRSASNHTKEKARDLKDMIEDKMRAK
ncbi:DUF2225 domain-containing protein [Butyrivibrio fibrisolvens]|uniref:DUF2225 domain-containing protein n=1 Tax=Butyrivibrio fibrisolvens TaxID=831 RepID=A0A1H9W1I1_BUTFI|nr:DUF2225 domain-containing protein [Butyrivibrio fibrisolvens]SES27547.1 hypothetical protein SAMN04487884_12642 [Butyrivibrio fibrisolvens]